MAQQSSRHALLFLVSAWLCHAIMVSAFQSPMINTRSLSALPPLDMVATTSEQETPKKEGYVPKWTKKKTLADEIGDLDFADKGIKGTIAVVFKQGNVTKRSMAFAGQPVRDVATQAGQFIKYGCGKGECGTCEALCNGKWIRPCTAVVPASIAEGQDYVVQVKEVKVKSASSGTFFSFRSFIMGFYNNLLGMVGFVKYRENAKKNWEERQDYESLIRQKTREKKERRRAELLAKKKLEGQGFSP